MSYFFFSSYFPVTISAEGCLASPALPLYIDLLAWAKFFDELQSRFAQSGSKYLYKHASSEEDGKHNVIVVCDQSSGH